MGEVWWDATVQVIVDGQQHEMNGEGLTLLDVLRDVLGIASVKDGCSPQGQCGCCTVLVDGEPRVACVTPAKRVDGRQVTTVDGLDPVAREEWGQAFCDTGGSQCGFCTPGIVVRLEALRQRGDLTDRTAVDRALAAHLCRCTGWQTIREAAVEVATSGDRAARPRRDLELAARRATLEGRAPQIVDPQVAIGGVVFGDDGAPDDALVAVSDGHGSWALGETVTEARAAAGKVQGRRTTAPPVAPLDLPPGSWDRTLQTGWVEPAYLETDAAWCAPGGEPSSPLSNGGAFGGKLVSDVGAVARRLADEQGRAVRVRWSREDAVRWGPKRPPVAIGANRDGSGVIRVARTAGVAEAVGALADGWVIEEVDVAGPTTSVALRGAGWAEVAVVLSSLGDGPDAVSAPEGGRASAVIGDDGTIHVTVAAGEVLDEVVLRSYAIGAAHMGLGWCMSEGITLDDDGAPVDLTIRSFGIVRPAEMPIVQVTVEQSDRPPVNGSDAVFAAVAAAAWRRLGFPGAIGQLRSDG